MKKWITSICLASALAFAATTAAVCVTNEIWGYAEPNVLPASGFTGEVLEIPEYSENGKTAENIIIAPDGIVYSGDRMKLNVAGLYKVLYQIDGQTVKTDTCLCKYRAEDFFSGNRFTKAEGISTYKYVSEPTFTGMKYQVSQGAQIEFEHEIDISEKTKEDKLIELLIEPNEKEVLDYGQVILTFTDTQDDSKFFQVIASDGHLDSATSGGIAYVRAGANGQTAGGRTFQGGKVVFNTTDIYGAAAPFTFRAQFFEGETRYDYSLNIYYDNAEKALYIKNGINEYYGHKYLIADFDDAVTFGGSVWSGFSSDKVKLTVSFDKFQTASGNIIFKEIDGISFDSNEIVDDKAPTLTVDTQGEESAPNSALGKTYSLFKASAKDFYDGEVPVETSVQYQNLANEALYSVDVENGAFVTDKVGRYILTYKATDRFGNVAKQEYSFYCFGEAKEIYVTDTQMDVGEAFVYDSVTVKDVKDVTAIGGNGNLHVSCAVFAPDGSEVELKDNTFLAKQVGNYRVEYTATDYFGDSATVSETVLVQAGDKPIFINSPTLPEVLISGFTYTLPNVEAVVCEGSEVQNAVVKTFVDGNEVSGEFTAQTSGLAEVEYRAYYHGSDGEYEKIGCSAPIVNGNSGKDQAAYFYNADGNVTVTETRETVDLTFAQDGSVAFANVLNNKSFELTANYAVENAKYAMRIVLADSESQAKVTLKLAFSVSGATITTPGADSMPLTNRNGLFAIKYKHDNFLIQDVNNQTCAVILKDDNGNAFTGFKGGVYVKFFFDDVYGESKLSLQSLNGQALGYRRESLELAKDTTGPTININGEYIYKQKVGDELSVYTADAFDVLGQVSSFTVMVRDPDNNVVLNGTPDELHTVRLDKIGIYKIIYSAVDSYGNEAPLVGSSIMANDATKPTYSAEIAFDEYYRVGTGVRIPNVTVSDDYSVAYCDVFVELPTGEVRLVMHYANDVKVSYLSKSDESYPNSFKVDEDTFCLESAGKYKVTFMFYDEAYNYQVQQYQFTAVK